MVLVPLNAPPVFGMAFGVSAGLTGSPAGAAAGTPTAPQPQLVVAPQPLLQQSLLRRNRPNQLPRPQPLSQVLQLLQPKVGAGW